MPLGYDLRHSVVDEAKLESLTAAMLEAGGWPSSIPPVLVLGEQAITGVHRLSAAEATEIITPSDVPALNLEDEIEVDEDLAADILRWDDAALAHYLRSIGRDDLARIAALED